VVATLLYLKDEGGVLTRAVREKPTVEEKRKIWKVFLP
jgi:hypothetical protein